MVKIEIEAEEPKTEGKTQEEPERIENMEAVFDGIVDEEMSGYTEVFDKEPEKQEERSLADEVVVQDSAPDPEEAEDEKIRNLFVKNPSKSKKWIMPKSDRFFFDDTRKYLMFGVSFAAGTILCGVIVALCIFYISAGISGEIIKAGNNGETVVHTQPTGSVSRPSEQVSGEVKDETQTGPQLAVEADESDGEETTGKAAAHFGVSGKEISELFKGARQSEIDAYFELLSKIHAPETEKLLSEKNINGVNAFERSYMVWSYIMTAKKGNINPGVAALEAVSAIVYSDRFKVPLALTVGVMQTESAFRPDALSYCGACGPMQVMWDLHSALMSHVSIKKREELFTPNKGVKAGTFLLSRYASDEKNVVGGLKRYYGALSEKYIKSVLTHKHAFEMYESDIVKDMATAINRENINWENLSKPKVPVISANGKKTNGKGGGGSGSMPKTGQVEKENGSSVVYRNTGAITIKKPDGKIIQWRD